MCSRMYRMKIDRASARFGRLFSSQTRASRAPMLYIRIVIMSSILLIVFAY